VQKLRLFLIILLFPFASLAQQKTKIIVQKFDATNTDATDKNNTITYLRNPVFRQDNATLTCDSAVFYVTKNTFDAYNNVHINQGDTVNIYSTRLNYNGNTKIAHLTDNVKMIDKESVLTTNILDYNMATKIGTYITGGKIVTKDVTITSKNGQYLSRYNDAYFRYDVVAVTPQSVITSDTLRYNTKDKWTYFYGPTNIKGKDDNLYTENGAYNTETQIAFFGKKNLYTNGSKSLKGDSLHYNGVLGVGKAVRNIVFRDTSDKTVLYGQLGYYYKKDERTLVTKNPYMGMGTSDSIKVNGKLQPDSLWLGADTLETQMVLKKSLKLISSPVIKKDNELGEEEKPEKKIGEGKTKALTTEPPGKQKIDKKQPKKNNTEDKKDTTSKGKPVIPPDSVLKTLKDSIPPHVKTDSLLKKATDSIPKLVRTNPSAVKAKADSVLKSKASPLSKGKTDSLLNKVKTDPLLKGKSDPLSKGSALKGKADTSLKGKLSLKNPVLKDTIPFNPEDTVRTRAIKAYHKVRVYKSNMQAVADSLFYTSADSTLRWYKNPILWSEGSQQTGDTLYLQLKNKKLNTLQVLQNAFLVNVNADSARYNQIKGKLITVFFKDGKMKNMFVDGNAESIYFNQDDKTHDYTDMNQTVSSRLKIIFKEKAIQTITTVKEPDGVRTPMAELKEDVFLTGFTWKPELRPLSKKEVINGKAKATVKKAVKTAAKPTKNIPGVKPGSKLPIDTKGKPIGQAVQDLGKKVVPLVGKDSTILKDAASKMDSLLQKELKPDSLKPVIVPLKKK
jgi:lipopolysaccharide export system protein LptA